MLCAGCVMKPGLAKRRKNMLESGCLEGADSILIPVAVSLILVVAINKKGHHWKISFEV